MTHISSIEPTIGVAAVVYNTATTLPPSELKRRKIWWTAHRISTATSVITHAVIISILAAVIIAARPTEISSPLNAEFTIEDADGGGEDFGNADIEIDLPEQIASPLPDMVVSTALPVTIVPESSVAIASIASVQSTTAESTGGAKRGSGSLQGKRGSGSGAEESSKKGKGKVSFFGKEVQADTVAFVIDASKSMSGLRFQRAKTELVAALGKLQPEQRFFVVFYTNETYPMFFPDNTVELIEANQRNLGRVFHWIDQSQVQGGTQPQLAMAMTLKLKPDVVFFLSDGDIPFETQGIVKFNNDGSAVHTITFGSDVGSKIMRQIALRNDGEYRFIPDGF